MRIAFVYDRINKFGGAERVLLALHKIWPEAPIYTAVYNKEKASWANKIEIIPSFLNKLPFISTNHEMFPLLTPYAFETFDFDEFDVVLSVTSADAKSIITKPDTLHICYCLTPTRYLWSGYQEYLENPGFGQLNPLVKKLMQLFSPTLRRWDYISSNRPDKFIAISDTVKQRIRKYYRLEAEVIYPPVDTDKFRSKLPSSGAKQDYFLIVSRLVPYKKIDYVILAFNELGWKLKIIGNGIDEKRLKKLAGQNIEFINNGLTDEKLCWYYQNCKGFIFPGEEDFGLSAVEAQACGIAVLGIGRGGMSEIILPGVTGEIYKEYAKESLVSALKKFIKKNYSAAACRSNASRFTNQNFQLMMKKTVENYRKVWKENK